jgi:hypothetical protein
MIRLLTARFFLTLFCGTIGATEFASRLLAAPGNPGKYAITDIELVDDDFHVQGEYAGNTRIGYVGLQVVAQGDGKFVAVLYRGGLPGNGPSAKERSELQGSRDAGQTFLECDSYRVEMQPRLAVLSSAAGEPLGRLTRVVRQSATIGARPPRYADVLFDGSGDLQHFETAKLNDEGLLDVGALLKNPVRDFHMHLEFRTPYMPYARGQSRGNSGIYIQRRYEVQVLDSFGLKGAANECGGLYRQKSPDINMCFPPLAWQTYDIYFVAARFDDEGKKILDGVITVLHNGVAVHERYALKNKTGAGRPEGPAALPIQFQNHGNPVAFRNIWLVNYDAASRTGGLTKPTKIRRRSIFRRRRT